MPLGSITIPGPSMTGVSHACAPTSFDKSSTGALPDADVRPSVLSRCTSMPTWTPPDAAASRYAVLLRVIAAASDGESAGDDVGAESCRHSRYGVPFVSRKNAGSKDQ